MCGNVDSVKYLKLKVVGNRGQNWHNCNLVNSVFDARHYTPFSIYIHEVRVVMVVDIIDTKSPTPFPFAGCAMLRSVSCGDIESMVCRQSVGIYLTELLH